MSSESAMERLNGEVEAAQQCLLAAAFEVGGWVKPRELKERAQNGWRDSVLMAAFSDLVNEGFLELNQDLLVRPGQGAKRRLSALARLNNPTP